MSSLGGSAFQVDMAYKLRLRGGAGMWRFKEQQSEFAKKRRFG